MLANWLGMDVNLTLSLRYLGRHRTRTLLVMLSIALGVATLVATRVLNHTLVRAAEEAVSPFSGASDLIVVNGQTGMSYTLADEIRAAKIPGVRSVQPVVIGRVIIPELDNRSVLALGFEVPKVEGSGSDPAREQARRWGLSFQITATTGDGIDMIRKGQKPLIAGSDLAADMNKKAPPPEGYHVNLYVDPDKPNARGTAVRLIGTVEIDDKDSPAAALGTGFLIMELRDAAAILNPERTDYVSQINIDLDTANDLDEKQKEHRHREAKHLIQKVVGKRAEVRTVEENNDSIRDITAGLQLGFHLGGAGALVIGLFLVFNAMSVSVAERRHDIGILRSVGATRRQVAGLFVGEAWALGVLGSGLGIPLGWLMARIAIGPIRGIIGEVIGPLPVSSVVVTPALGLLAALAGTLATVAASLIPALSAAREEPADAVRRVPLVASLLHRLLQFGAITLLLLGCILCTRYRDALPRRLGAFSGVICLMLAAVFATPLLASVVGRVFQPIFRRLFGLEGRLAADNLVRSSGRVGLVIAALTATTALLVQTAGFIVSSEQAILGWLDHKVSADMYVTGGSGIESSGMQVPMDEAVGAQIKKELPEAEAVLAARIHPLNFRGRIILLVAIDTEAFGHDQRRFLSRNLARYPQLRERRVLPIDAASTLGLMGTTSGQGPCLAAAILRARPRVQPVLASENFAALYGIKPGERFSVPGRNDDIELELVDTVEDYLWNRGVILVDRAWYRDTFGDHKVDMYDVFLTEGADTQAAKERLEQWGKKRVLFVATKEEVREGISSGLRKFYSLAYAQQVLVGMVALLGVISALFISVLQRTREFGLLRAVGASRVQILRSVLAEAALMGIIGAVLGLALGFVLEWYILDVLLLDEAGFLFPLRFPWLESGVVAVAAVLSATLVGLLPAWHATRLRIPEAIAYE